MLVASKNENFLDQNIDWEFPIPIAYGPGRLSEIGLFCEQFQISNPLIITDEGSKNLPFINRLITLLQKASIPSKLFFESLLTQEMTKSWQDAKHIVLANMIA